jgi:hypothetical protein
MSLLTYQEARPWAKAMKTAVLTKKMPPWFADPNYGHFSEEARVSCRKRKSRPSRLGRQRRSGGGSQGQAGAPRVLRRRLEHPARHRVRHAESLSNSRLGNHRIHRGRDSHRLHQRHVGIGGGNSSRQPRLCPSYAGLHPAAGIDLAEGGQARRVLRADSVQARRERVSSRRGRRPQNQENQAEEEDPTSRYWQLAVYVPASSRRTSR